MIEVRELVEGMLYDLNEMYSRKHSDEEFIHAINAILRYVNLALINKDSYHITKQISVRPKNGKASLPSDFAKLRGFDKDFTGEYTLIGSTLYIDSEAVMRYFYTIEPVESIDDEIDLPYLFFDIILQFAEMIINGTADKNGLANLVLAEVDKLTSSDASQPIVRPMEFYV